LAFKDALACNDDLAQQTWTNVFVSKSEGASANSLKSPSDDPSSEDERASFMYNFFTVRVELQNLCLSTCLIRSCRIAVTFEVAILFY